MGQAPPGSSSLRTNSVCLGQASSTEGSRPINQEPPRWTPNHGKGQLATAVTLAIHQMSMYPCVHAHTCTQAEQLGQSRVITWGPWCLLGTVAWHLTAQRKRLVAAILAQGLFHLHQRLCYSGKREVPRRERPEPAGVGSQEGASLEGGRSDEAPLVSSLLSCGLGWSPDIHEQWPPSGA